MKKALAPNARIVSFDVLPWNQFPGTVLKESDFQDGRLVQVLDDISTEAGFQKNRKILETADFFFLDAAKDGFMERRIMRFLEGIQFPVPPLLVFDDIRVWNMLRTWREIRKPKIDLTSFGHWSGTGLVEWK